MTTAASTTPMEDRIAALQDRTLFLLDDDQALRTRMGRALEARGFEVTTAGSVGEATELLRTLPKSSSIEGDRASKGVKAVWESVSRVKLPRSNERNTLKALSERRSEHDRAG